FFGVPTLFTVFPADLRLCGGRVGDPRSRRQVGSSQSNSDDPDNGRSNVLQGSSLGELQNPAQHSTHADNRHPGNGRLVSDAVPTARSAASYGRDGCRNRNGSFSAGIDLSAGGDVPLSRV